MRHNCKLSEQLKESKFWLRSKELYLKLQSKKSPLLNNNWPTFMISAVWHFLHKSIKSNLRKLPKIYNQRKLISSLATPQLLMLSHLKECWLEKRMYKPTWFKVRKTWWRSRGSVCNIRRTWWPSKSVFSNYFSSRWSRMSWSNLSYRWRRRSPKYLKVNIRLLMIQFRWSKMLLKVWERPTVVI